MGRPRKLRGLNERLEEVINTSGFTLTDIANKTGLNRETLWHYMVDGTQPNPFSLFKLCRFLNVSADWLLGLSDKKQLN